MKKKTTTTTTTKKNKAMEGALLVYNRSSPPISDFFLIIFLLKKSQTMCTMGVINGRLIEVKTMKEPLLRRPKCPRPLNRGFNSPILFYNNFGVLVCGLLIWWPLNGGSTVCALCLPHPSVYPALQHAVLPPHNRPAVQGLLKFFNIITSVN